MQYEKKNDVNIGSKLSGNYSKNLHLYEFIFYTKKLQIHVGNKPKLKLTVNQQNNYFDSK